MKDKEVCTLYKYCGTKYIEDIIENERLFMSNRDALNDPFELIVFDNEKKINKKLSNIKILCLTNSYRKKLMWSHYTDNHKGICLTVELSKKYVYPICYTSKRIFTKTNLDEILAKNKMIPKKNLTKKYDIEDKYKPAFIKDHKWIYEKEYRVVTDNTFNDEIIIQEGDKTYMKIKIKTIYLGVNISQEDRKTIIELCKNKNINIKNICLSTTDYSLKIE